MLEGFWLCLGESLYGEQARAKLVAIGLIVAGTLLAEAEKSSAFRWGEGGRIRDEPVRLDFGINPR